MNSAHLDLGPKRDHALSVLDYFAGSKLRVAVYAVDKGYWDFADRVAHRLGCHRQSHLHTEAAHVGRLEELLQHRSLVQSEAAGQIANAWSQHCIGKDVGTLARKLPLQVPAVDAATRPVARARNNVVIVLLLQRDHLGDELGVVAEVGVHDNNVVTLGELQAVNVGGTEAELASAGLEDDMRRVGLDELLGDFLGAIGRAVVDDDEFPVNVAGKGKGWSAWSRITREADNGRIGDVLFSKGALQQPCDDGQVLALVECGQDHRVGVHGRGFLAWRHRKSVLQRKRKSQLKNLGSVENQSKLKNGARENGGIKKSVAKGGRDQMVNHG